MSAESKGAYFAWRGAVRKRQSTDLDVLDHPLLREAWSAAWAGGVRNHVALEAEFAGALEVTRRMANLLEDLANERAAFGIVGSDDTDDDAA